MTVRELIEMLEDFPDDMKIVVQPANSGYCDSISHVADGYGVRAYWGNDYEALMLCCGRQVGAVWELDELDLEEE